MKQLTPLDAQFLALEDGRSHSHVTSLAIYDPATAEGGRLTRDAVKKLLAARLHLVAPMRRRLVEVPFNLDYPYWVEDDAVDLDFHVRELALPAPGDRRQLADQIERIVSRPLDRSRPLWELYVIQGVDGDKVALLTKLHHASIDGVSGTELMSNLFFDTDPQGRDVPPGPPVLPARSAPSRLELLARGAASVPRQQLRALAGIPRTLPHLDALITTRPLPGARAIARVSRAVARRVNGISAPEGTRVTAPRTMVNGMVSPYRRFSFGSVPLADVKRIKDDQGVTVNDVVVAACAGALRTWLIARDALPAEPLVAGVPVSMRATDDNGTFGNAVSMLVAPIPTNEPDLVQRLARTHETLRAAKERNRSMPATIMADVNYLTPPALLWAASRTILTLGSGPRSPLEPGVNVIISNVPGPADQRYCAGAKLLAHYPVSMILHSCALNISVLRYGDALDFGVIGDRGAVDDAWELLEALRAEFEALLALSAETADSAAR